MTSNGWSANAINISARLCALAEGGQILATEQLTHLAQALVGISYVKRNAVSVKGIELPVRNVEVLAEGASPQLELKAMGLTRAAPLPQQRRSRRPYVAAALVIALLTVSIPLLASARHRTSSALPPNVLGSLSLTNGSRNRSVQAGSSPGAVAANASEVYAVNSADDSVTRIDTRNASNAANTIAVGHDPTAVAIGLGAAWVANSADRTVSRINAGSPPSVGDTIAVGNGPDAIATGFGLVWVANQIDDTISVINPTSTDGRPADEVVATIPVGAAPDALLATRSSIWVADGGSSTVLRIDPTSRTVVASVDVGNGPAGLAAGSSGPWVINGRDGTASHILESANSVQATVHVGPVPSSIVAAKGKLWVADSGADSITEIQDSTGRMVRTLALGNAPQSLAISGSSLWVSTHGPSALHRGGTFSIVASDESDSLDPAAGYSTFASDVISTMNDGLVGFQRTSGAAGALVVPDLAAQLPVISTDGKTYTFQLRQGIRYSTGALLRASDVRASLERELRLGKAAAYYDGIVGASACTVKKCDLGNGVITDDATGTVAIRLTAVDPDFLFKLALTFASVLPAATPVRDLGFTAHASTGPYMIGSSSAQTITLVRNPVFKPWSAAAQPPAFPDRVQITITPSSANSASANAGAVADDRYDWTPDQAPATTLTALLHTHSGQLHAYDTNGLYYYFLNTAAAPFNDVRVRRAVNLAVDRKAAVNAFGGPLVAEPTCQSTAPAVFGYSAYCPYTKDPSPSGRWQAPDIAGARDLVARAHATGSKVVVYASPDHPEVGALMVAAMRSIGLDASLHVFHAAGVTAENQGFAYYEFVGDKSHEVQAGFEGWFVDYPEPSNLFTQVLRCNNIASQGNLDESQFCNQGIDTQMDVALGLQTSDPADAGASWAAVDHSVTDQAPWVPLVNTKGFDVVSSRVRNYQSQPQLGLLFDQSWLR